MQAERRRQRSRIHSQALTLLLDACRARAGLEALVLADQDGLVVSAAAPAHIDIAEIAAILPLPGERLPEVRAVRFMLDGYALYLGAIGAMGEAWVREMMNALRGTQRILAN